LKDYVSEKVFDGLLAGTLPVYWGSETVDKFMPAEPGSGREAVIKMSDFGEDYQRLAETLKSLARDEGSYEKYFEWKELEPSARFQGIIDMTAYKFTTLCRFCQALGEAERNGHNPTHVDGD